MLNQMHTKVMLAIIRLWDLEETNSHLADKARLITFILRNSPRQIISMIHMKEFYKTVTAKFLYGIVMINKNNRFQVL